MRPATKPLGSTLQPGQSQPQSSFAAICGTGTLSSTRSLTFRTVAVSARIATRCRAKILHFGWKKPYSNVASNSMNALSSSSE
jgi:hypothetical protein